ncbi:MAG: cell wall-active antibiotics response protein [Oscillospiraceae bacterium]|nr:cell wall-active antibiotics response protein [Oscillospiraceae bacterium]
MKRYKIGNIVWGLLFIVAAGMIVLHLMGLLGEFSVWSLLLSIPLAGGAVWSAIRREWWGMFMLMGFLVLIYRRNIEYALDISIGFWAIFGIAALLAIGCSLIFGKKGKKKLINVNLGHKNGKSYSRRTGENVRYKNSDRGNRGYDIHVSRGKKGKDVHIVNVDGEDVHVFNADDIGDDDDDGDEHTVENVSGDEIYFEERFSGTSKYISSENLSYVSIDNSFGSMEVYFDNATLSPEGAVVDISNSFGGVELYIPREWNVINNVSTSFGGTDAPERAQKEGAPTITICGSNSFGGVDVELI